MQSVGRPLETSRQPCQANALVAKSSFTMRQCQRFFANQNRMQNKAAADHDVASVALGTPLLEFLA